jgi:hypothetical protein
MIDVEEAVKAVVDYVQRFGSLLPSGGPRLEEFDYDESDAHWVITMSFDDPYGPARVYKTFAVDKEDKVQSMRIRDVRNPLLRERI